MASEDERPAAIPSAREYLRLVALGALVGLPAALLAALFLAMVHEAEHRLWNDLPDALGRDSPPWYLVLALPLVGAVIVAVARRFLPGDGGHRPLEGIGGGPTPVAYVPGVVLAALGSLPFGLVLGPEAPVIALGTAVGLAVNKWAKLDGPAAQVVANAGAFSAISALFGGPIVAGVLLVEAGVGLGAALLPALLPGFVAAAVGYLLFVGFGDFGGLDTPGLSVPGLATYDGVHAGDLALAVTVGVLTALAVVLVKALARRVEGLAPRMGLLRLLLAGGLAVGLAALAAQACGAEPQEVLFSGQNSIPAVVDESSVGVIVAVLVAKLLAYAVSLGSGFRGGPIFPALFLGVGIASVAVAWFDASPTWAIAVGAGAGMAAQARLLLAPAVFGALLVGQAGADTAPAVVLAVAAAWLVATGLDKTATQASATGPAEPGR